MAFVRHDHAQMHRRVDSSANGASPVVENEINEQERVLKETFAAELPSGRPKEETENFHSVITAELGP